LFFFFFSFCLRILLERNKVKKNKSSQEIHAGQIADGI
jgi:hypothetical protein